MGTVIYYTCADGFIGNSQRTCTDDGAWSGRDPECVESKCINGFVCYIRIFRSSRESHNESMMMTVFDVYSISIVYVSASASVWVLVMHYSVNIVQTANDLFVYFYLRLTRKSHYVLIYFFRNCQRYSMHIVL